MINAQLFYKDSTNIIYSLADNQSGRYFLNIPVSEYNNFMLFLKLKTEDNTKKGTSEFSNENLKRKQFLEEVIKVNNFIKMLNSNMVYSRVNRLYELPEKELQDVLDKNKPLDMQKYQELTKKIDDIINENFRLMTSSNIKKESIEQTILLISQKEEDKKFIEWLKENLSSNYTQQNLEDLRMEYKKQTIQWNIEDYQEVINNNEKYIVGKNTKGEMYTVKIPNQYNMLQVFEMELKTVDKSKLANLDPKMVATILFDKIIIDLPPAEKMEKTHEEEQNKEENKQEQNILNNQIADESDNYLVDKTNNIAVNTIDNTTIAIENAENGQIIANETEVNTYNFDPTAGQPSQVETQIQSQGKKRVLAPPKNDYGFIKIGTIILFGLSFILTIISLILLIAS